MVFGFMSLLDLCLGCSRAAGLNPTFRRALFERSELRSPVIWYGGEEPRRAAPEQTWFWPLLPKHKVARRMGAKPHRIH